MVLDWLPRSRPPNVDDLVAKGRYKQAVAALCTQFEGRQPHARRATPPRGPAGPRGPRRAGLPHPPRRGRRARPATASPTGPSRRCAGPTRSRPDTPRSEAGSRPSRARRARELRRQAARRRRRQPRRRPGAPSRPLRPRRRSTRSGFRSCAPSATGRRAAATRSRPRSSPASRWTSSTTLPWGCTGGWCPRAASSSARATPATASS
jgi:hypothetical protein